MAILNNSNAISSGGYDINNSLRFRSSASAYLSRTPSASNRKTWTYSFWAKVSTTSNNPTLSVDSASSTDRFHLGFGWTNPIEILDRQSSANNIVLETTQVFRDPSAWYHCVVAMDTTQATASNRVKIYVNGTQITAFATATYPSQNYDTLVNAAKLHQIARESANGSQLNVMDGYMTEVNFVDGQALTPSSFGETDTTTGSWKPKAYTSTYGTNGFYLKFSDIATTSGSNAGLGKDFSGNTNYWTTNNISVTAGTTYDAMTDSPTLTSATVANYCVMNPLFVSTSTISNANLQVVTTVGTGGLVIGTIGGLTTGKYYWEATIIAQTNNPSNTSTVGIVNKITGRSSDYLDTPDGDKFANPSAATNDILGVAVDFDSGSMSVYKNNTLSTTVSFTSSLGWYPAFSDAHGNQNTTLAINFGQRPFAYTPPTGFVRLNTYNL